MYNDEIYNVATSYEGVHIPYGTSAGHIGLLALRSQDHREATGHQFHYMVANDYPRSPHFSRVDKPEGDIVFWHNTPHGHVAVVLDTTRVFIGCAEHPRRRHRSLHQPH